MLIRTRIEEIFTVPVVVQNQIYVYVAEVYAAREKNGIYIPRDRYLHEEAEKKVSICELTVYCTYIILYIF